MSIVEQHIDFVWSIRLTTAEVDLATFPIVVIDCDLVFCKMGLKLFQFSDPRSSAGICTCALEINF